MSFLVGKTVEQSNVTGQTGGVYKDLLNYISGQGFAGLNPGTSVDAASIRPYQDLFSQQNARNFAQAKESAGNLSGSGLTNQDSSTTQQRRRRLQHHSSFQELDSRQAQLAWWEEQLVQQEETGDHLRVLSWVRRQCTGFRGAHGELHQTHTGSALRSLIHSLDCS